jgi:hypothetical protein
LLAIHPYERPLKGRQRWWGGDPRNSRGIRLPPVAVVLQPTVVVGPFVPRPRGAAAVTAQLAGEAALRGIVRDAGVGDI